MKKKKQIMRRRKKVRWEQRVEILKQKKEKDVIFKYLKGRVGKKGKGAVRGEGGRKKAKIGLFGHGIAS